MRTCAPCRQDPDAGGRGTRPATQKLILHPRRRRRNLSGAKAAKPRRFRRSPGAAPGPSPGAIFASDVGVDNDSVSAQGRRLFLVRKTVSIDPSRRHRSTRSSSPAILALLESTPNATPPPRPVGSRRRKIDAVSVAEIRRRRAGVPGANNMPRVLKGSGGLCEPKAAVAQSSACPSASPASGSWPQGRARWCSRSRTTATPPLSRERT